MSNYKCKDHKLDIVCLGCVIALNHRHNRMLNFIKDLEYSASSDVAEDCTELLKDIGK